MAGPRYSPPRNPQGQVPMSLSRTSRACMVCSIVQTQKVACCALTHRRDADLNSNSTIAVVQIAKRLSNSEGARTPYQNAHHSCSKES